MVSSFLWGIEEILLIDCPEKELTLNGQYQKENQGFSLKNKSRIIRIMHDFLKVLLSWQTLPN